MRDHRVGGIIRLFYSCTSGFARSTVLAALAQQGHASSVLSSGSRRAGSASAAQKPAKDLKAALRSLFKLVHPDLFEGHPKEKEANERSFKLLQDYLSQARTPDLRSPAARTPYHFSFYLHAQQCTDEDPADGASGTSSPGPAPADRSASDATKPPSTAKPQQGQEEKEQPPPPPQLFKHVAVSLPPPTPGTPGAGGGGGGSGGGGAQESALPALTTKALCRLLSACGLNVDGLADSAGGGSGAFGGAGVGAHVPMASWLPDAVEALRQEELHGVAPAQSLRVANLRGAFRMVHELMVNFAPPVDLVPLARQVQALEDLARLLESTPQLSLRGCRVILGQRLALDREGSLHLSLAESPAAWRAFLEQVDLPFARQQRRHLQAVRSLEQSVARAMGVAIVHTTHQYALDVGYRQVLESLAAEAGERGPVFAGTRLHHLTVSVVPLKQGSPVTEGLDEQSGALTVSAHGSAADVYRLVQSHGDRGAAIAQGLQAKKAETEALTERVRRQLRLRRLSRDDRLASEDYHRACGKLLEQSAALGHILEGSSLRIGFANRVATGCLELAWDFEF